MKRERFTLIELIIVIAILGILAGIIIPNTSSFKDEANEVAMTADIKNLQTAIDVYRIKNMNNTPTISKPTITNPVAVDFEKLVPKYLREKPKEGFYWIDYAGITWASLVDAPTGITISENHLIWNKPEGELKNFNIYGVTNMSGRTDYKMDFIASTTENTFNLAGLNFDSYLVSSVDTINSESAKAGYDYLGIGIESEEITFSGKIVDSNIFISKTKPDEGWKRYSDRNSGITYTGEVYQDLYTLTGDHSHTTYSNIYDDSKINFKFYGDKLRLMAYCGDSNYFSNNIGIKIDGKIMRYNQVTTGSPSFDQVMFEVDSMENKVHDVEIFVDEETIPRVDGKRIAQLAAIDINDTGYIIGNRPEYLTVYNFKDDFTESTSSNIVSEWGKLGNGVQYTSKTGTAWGTKLFYTTINANNNVTVTTRINSLKRLSGAENETFINMYISKTDRYINNVRVYDTGTNFKVRLMGNGTIMYFPKNNGLEITISGSTADVIINGIAYSNKWTYFSAMPSGLNRLVYESGYEGSSASLESDIEYFKYTTDTILLNEFKY